MEPGARLGAAHLELLQRARMFHDVAEHRHVAGALVEVLHAGVLADRVHLPAQLLVLQLLRVLHVVHDFVAVDGPALEVGERLARVDERRPELEPGLGGAGNEIQGVIQKRHVRKLLSLARNRQPLQAPYRSFFVGVGYPLRPA